VTETPPPPTVPTTTPTPPAPMTTTLPPEEEPPLPPVPEDTTLAVGEPYDHTDAEGKVLYSITLVSVDSALTCTAPGSLPAENGHLIGLQVEVVDPEPPAEGEPPSVSAADFRFLGTDDVLTADVLTASSAACLEDDWPSGGTVVLDVPAVTGTVVYRPAS
jgi:hypothetical protein